MSSARPSPLPSPSTPKKSKEQRREIKHYGFFLGSEKEDNSRAGKHNAKREMVRNAMEDYEDQRVATSMRMSRNQDNQ